MKDGGNFAHPECYWRRGAEDAAAALSAARAEIAELREELGNIANAKRFDRECFDDDTAFADWAQSRCRFRLSRTLKGD